MTDKPAEPVCKCGQPADSCLHDATLPAGTGLYGTTSGHIGRTHPFEPPPPVCKTCPDSPALLGNGKCPECTPIHKEGRGRAAYAVRAERGHVSRLLEDELGGFYLSAPEDSPMGVLRKRLHDPLPPPEPAGPCPKTADGAHEKVLHGEWVCIYCKADLSALRAEPPPTALPPEPKPDPKCSCCGHLLSQHWYPAPDRPWCPGLTAMEGEGFIPAPSQSCRECNLESEIGTQDVPHPIDPRVHECQLRKPGGYAEPPPTAEPITRIREIARDIEDYYDNHGDVDAEPLKRAWQELYQVAYEMEGGGTP